MKKVLLGFTTALLTVILCLTLAGCASSVAGKTYNYDSFTVKYDDSVRNEDKERYEKVIDAALSLYKISYTFDENGKVNPVAGISLVSYEQDGNKVTLKGSLSGVSTTQFTVSGSKLKTTLSSKDLNLTNIAGVTDVTIIYKQK